MPSLECANSSVPSFLDHEEEALLVLVQAAQGLADHGPEVHDRAVDVGPALYCPPRKTVPCTGVRRLSTVVDTPAQLNLLRSRGPLTRSNPGKKYQHMNAVMRFLFAAVTIKEAVRKSRYSDYGRIDIEQNPI
ncbi:hypothetical protein [Streptomyces brevispora]|uniref:hypothetical protein n=1 Tax=Streptomyces brevispora TaxID=887462 RepID=UPI0035E21425